MAAKAIGASVGAGGVNRGEDVKTIQRLLNQAPLAEAGASPKLVDDGKCGPLTVGAIRKFQFRHLGFSDGRVDPGGKTLAKLNEKAGAGGGLAPPQPPAGPVPVPYPNTAAPPALRAKIIEVAKEMATPSPGKVSDLVTMQDPETGWTVRQGWKYLKDFFDTGVAGWQEAYWKDPDYIKGVKIPGKRIPQPGRSGVSWCGIFATWVLIKSGMPVKWVLGGGIQPLPKLGDKHFQPGDVLVMKGAEVHHCIAISDDGSTMQTVNGNSDAQSILIKPVQKANVWYYYKVGP